MNTSLAKSEAKMLHEKIKGKDYNHEEVIRILTTRSKAQLLATFNDYKNQFGNPINKVCTTYQFGHPINTHCFNAICQFDSPIAIYKQFFATS